LEHVIYLMGPSDTSFATGCYFPQTMRGEFGYALFRRTDLDIGWRKG
jgi:hypothetical protein